MNVKLILFAMMLPASSLFAQTLTFTNTTRGGSSYFAVGDAFQLNISGAASSAVTYTQTFNGTPSGPFSAGSTNAGGTYTLSATLTSGSIGTWTEIWYVGGVQATPSLAFQVLGPPSVTLTNTTRGGSTAFYVGDGLQLDVTGGLPTTAVTYTLNLNDGGAGSPISAGTTDGSGAYHLTGTIASNPGDAGTNVEVWAVGGVQGTPTLSFSVYVGCPSLSTFGYKLDWNPTFWNYSGSLSSSDISGAFGDWNAAQSITPFTEATGTDPYMLVIVDGSLPANVYGQTHVYSYAGDPGGSPSVAADACYLFESATCSSMCLNNSKQWFANITLDNSKMSGGIWGRDAHFLTRATLAHEIGHAVGIADTTAVDCATNETTLMSFQAVTQCGFDVPQGCDLTYQTSRYSGTTVYSWASCGPNCGATACSN